MAETAKPMPPLQSGGEALTPEELEKERILDEIESGPEFRALGKAKLKFILPATIFFMVYYFALPILVGFFPETMDTRLFPGFSLAYLFALSQFFMAWILAFIYLLSFAPRMDRMVANIVEAVSKRDIRIARRGERK